jgi:hypothetical protein
MVTILLLLATVPAAPDAPTAQELLANARGLYASAAYEEALAALGSAAAADPAVAAEIERYRALCHFALGNPEAARTAVANMVDQHPLYVPSEADVPPRLLAMLHEVRREMLPDIARRSYAEIRGELTAGRARGAAPALERIVLLASDPDVHDVEGMDDLRLLADGFLALAKAANGPAAPAPSTTTSAEASEVDASAAPGAASAPPARTIYTAADTDVVAPQTVDQTLPPWALNRSSRTGMTFNGYIRIIIDESGSVESAMLLRTVHPAYDPELLRAAKNWRFTAARKDGAPVKYLKVIQVVMKDM